MEVKNFDTLYASLNELTKMFQKRQRSKFDSFEFRAGSPSPKTTKAAKAHGDAFFVAAETKIDEIKSVYYITRKNENSAGNARRIDKLITYISANKSLFYSPYTISPKYYNVVIVKEN